MLSRRQAVFFGSTEGSRGSAELSVSRVRGRSACIIFERLPSWHVSNALLSRSVVCGRATEDLACTADSPSSRQADLVALLLRCSGDSSVPRERCSWLARRAGCSAGYELEAGGSAVCRVSCVGSSRCSARRKQRNSLRAAELLGQCAAGYRAGCATRLPLCISAYRACLKSHWNEEIAPQESFTGPFCSCGGLCGSVQPAVQAAVRLIVQPGSATRCPASIL